MSTAEANPSAVPSASGNSHLSVSERAERGRTARNRAPRSSHAAFEPAADRPDPVDLLERQAQTRVPELVPIRYGRMLVSPFTFYRGAAAVMARDLADTPQSALTVQCCGDAHLSNFGVFASPERRLVFDINDFDETLPGPWEWDVKRLATSMLIAARDNEFSPADQQRAVLQTVARYRTTMREFASETNLAVWYRNMDIESLLDLRRNELRRAATRRTERELAKARTRDHTTSFSKLARFTDDGEPRIVDQSPLIVPIDVLVTEERRDFIFEELERLLETYRSTLSVDRRALIDQYRLVDAARKVVGVGSVGTRAWIALMLGRDSADALVMQIKEAEASVLEAHLEPSEFDHHGQRVVVGQRLMQASSDIFLGWLTVEQGYDGVPHQYYVRQLKDWKGSVEIEQMRAYGLAIYGELCGWTLARAHARSGDRVAIASYLGKADVFDRAILEFSTAYAEQNERDYAALAAAAKSGRIQVEAGI